MNIVLLTRFRDLLKFCERWFEMGPNKAQQPLGLVGLPWLPLPRLLWLIYIYI